MREACEGTRMFWKKIIKPDTHLYQSELCNAWLKQEDLGSMILALKRQNRSVRGRFSCRVMLAGTSESRPLLGSLLHNSLEGFIDPNAFATQ
jgi:hypothetical protein